MLSQTATYAIKLAAFLAAAQAEDKAAADKAAKEAAEAGLDEPSRDPSPFHLLRDIAEAIDVYPAYLAKISQSLVRAGVVQARTGKGGGVRLAEPAKEISVLRVIESVDPTPGKLAICPFGHPRCVNRKGVCSLFGAQKALLGWMRETKLADLEQIREKTGASVVFQAASRAS